VTRRPTFPLLPLAVAAAALALLPKAGARADEGDLICAAAKKILSKLDKDEVALRGKRVSTNAKSSLYEGTVDLPTAKGCYYLEYSDGSKPFYSCTLETPVCSKAEKRFDKVAVDLSVCLEPAEEQIKMDEGKMQAKWPIRGKLQARLVLKTAGKCDLTFYAEKG
jgi:hypothetical protein